MPKFIGRFTPGLGSGKGKWIESIRRRDDDNIQYHTDDEVCFEWLLLGFMAKEMLPNKRATPPAHSPEYQQSRFWHSPPCLTSCHFVHPINHQRQYVGKQQPYNKGMGCKNTSERREDQ